MTNTILNAKNTFGDGLVLDISPENTGANNLSSALNATLITANGNEMTLQNDMGNARVETAYLPDGYIPIGTCEFGDIIYIVSYNPLVNKALIGCFPSPERNISSEEVSSMLQSLTSADFLILDKDNNPTGELKTMLVKKTLFDGKLLRPGDKYLIYTSDKNNDFFKYVSLYGSNGEDFPKLVKLRVASVDSEGKLTYLDSYTKWYENGGDMENYFIAYMEKPDNGPIDIDSYRTVIDSAYSVFLNKNAGTLTLVAELETIDTFSCSYSVLKSKDGDRNVYLVFLHPSWTSSNNNISIDGIRIEGNIASNAHIYNEEKWINMSNFVPELELSRSYKPEGDSSNSFDTINYDYFNTHNYNTVIEDQLKWERFSENSLNRIIQEALGKNESIDVCLLEESDIEQLTLLIEGKLEEYLLPESSMQVLDTSFSDLKINEDKYLGLTLSLLYVYYTLVYNQDRKGFVYGNTLYEVTTNPYIIAKQIPEISTISLKKLDVEYDYKSLYYANLLEYSEGSYYFSFDNTKIKLRPNTINSDIINYKFNRDTSLSVLIVKPNTNSGSIDNFIWNITVYPRMPYGYLSHLGVPLTIDFSKVGDNSIELTHWKYYNEGHLSTLTYGFNTNLAPNYKVTKVTFELFDDIGLVATYTSNEKVSYNGVFTERFGLNGLNLNYKLSSNDLTGKGITNRDDAGILHSNMLYGVRIKVTYGTINELGLLITKNDKTFYRWYWTNNMFNDKYYLDNDFDFKEVELPASCNYKLESDSSFKTQLVAYYNTTPDNNDLRTTLGADVSYVSGGLDLSLNVGLLNNYNTFAPMESYKDKDTENDISFKVPCKIGVGRSSITQSYSKIGKDNGDKSPYISDLTPEIAYGNNILSGKSETLLKLLGKSDGNGPNVYEIWEKPDPNDLTKNIGVYKSQFKLTLDNPDGSDKQSYLIDDNKYDVYYQKSCDLVSGMLLSHKLQLEGISFDKVMLSELKHINESYAVIKPLWDNEDYRTNLGITESRGANGKLWDYFNTVVVLTMPTVGVEAKVGTISYTSATVYDSTSYVSYTNKTIPKNTNCSYNNEHLLQALKETGVKGPFILLCWSAHFTSNNSREPEQFLVGNETFNNPTSHYSDIFNIAVNDDNERYRGAFFLLAMYKPMEYVYLLNDVFWYTRSTTTHPFAQVYNGLILNLEESGVNILQSGLLDALPSIASFVTLMSKQIYYQSSDSTDQSYLILSGLSGTLDFQEDWEQHIVISMEPTDEYSKSIMLLRSINEKKSLYDYMQSIKGKLSGLSELLVKLENNVLVITIKFNVPDMYLLKDIYTEKGQSPVAVWNDGKVNKFIYKDRSDELMYVKNGELQPLDADFTVLEEKSNLYKYIKRDKEQLIGMRSYPDTNQYRLGNQGTDDSGHGPCYYQGASKDITATGYYKTII